MVESPCILGWRCSPCYDSKLWPRRKLRNGRRSSVDHSSGASVSRWSDLEETARAYESVRRPIVNRIQSASALVGVLAQGRSPAARLVRDNLLLLTSRIEALRRRELRLLAGYNPKEESFLR